MNWFERIAVLVLLIIIAGGISEGLRGLSGVLRRLREIHEEIQGLRRDLYRERHPKEDRDPFA
jgi:hypothetical protein